MKNKFLKFIGYTFACNSLIITVARAVILPPTPKVTLSWDYPADQLGTNLTFKIYHTTNVALPMANWALLTNVVGTNLSANFPLAAGPHFFALTASNSSGESAFATVSP